MPHVYVCDECPTEVRLFIEPAYDYDYCVACDSRGCGHRDPKPAVWCQNARNHRNGRALRMRQRINAEVRSIA